MNDEMQSFQPIDSRFMIGHADKDGPIIPGINTSPWKCVSAKKAQEAPVTPIAEIWSFHVVNGQSSQT
jgi:hypothetical protein